MDLAELAMELQLLNGKLRRRLRAQATIGDMTPSQIAVLVYLERNPAGATVTELAQAEGVRTQSMGATVAALQAEGLVFDKGGRIIKGIHPRNAWVPVQPNDKGKVRFYVEAAANPEVLRSRSFAPTSVGRKETADPTPLYRLARADLVEVHHEVRVRVWFGCFLYHRGH